MTPGSCRAGPDPASNKPSDRRTSTPRTTPQSAKAPTTPVGVRLGVVVLLDPGAASHSLPGGGPWLSCGDHVIPGWDTLGEDTQVGADVGRGASIPSKKNNVHRRTAGPAPRTDRRAVNRGGLQPTNGRLAGMSDAKKRRRTAGSASASRPQRPHRDRPTGPGCRCSAPGP